MAQPPVYPPPRDTQYSVPPPHCYPVNPPSEVFPNASQAFSNSNFPNGSNQFNGSEYPGYGHPSNQYSLSLSNASAAQPLNGSTPQPLSLQPQGFQQPQSFQNPSLQGPVNGSTAQPQSLRRPVTPSEINAYAIRLFTKYDTNRSGSLGLDDTKKVLDDFCREVKLQKVTYEDLGRLFQLFDFDGNGKIRLGEFKVMLEILGGIKEKLAVRNSQDPAAPPRFNNF